MLARREDDALDGEQPLVDLGEGEVVPSGEIFEGAAGPGLGFGVIPAVEALVSHLERAAAESGASDNLLRTHAGHVSQIATGMLANARQAAGRLG